MGRSKLPKRLPVMLTEMEVRRVLDRVDGQMYPLMARLLYGAGMRLMECVRLRVKDVAFERREIVVRAGKGNQPIHVPGLCGGTISTCRICNGQSNGR